MKVKHSFLMLLTLLFVFCKNEEQDKTIVNSACRSLNVPKIEAKRDNDSLKATKYGDVEYSFKFNTDESGYKLTSIRIYSNNRIHQIIKTNKEIQEKEFSLIDWNFDGYKDLTVLYNRGSGGAAYWIWNFNPQTKKFLYNKKLSEILGLEIDSISKKVIFNYKEGAW